MLCWTDVETTGLDPENDSLLEVGLVITDDHLNPVGTIAMVIEPLAKRLGDAHPTVQAMHQKSGLAVEIAAGHGNFITNAEHTLCEWMAARVEPGSTPMCGSSVHFDRQFLRRWMPVLESYFHYRNVDVSTIKELAERWSPEIVKTRPVPKKEHRVLPDIADTLEELRHYRTLFI